MQKSLLVLHGKAHGDTQTFLNGVKRGIGVYDAVYLAYENLLDEGGNVVVMIVKGVAGHAAGIGDVLNGDLV